MIAFEQIDPFVKFWQEDRTYHLDVRELLDNGGEPYEVIMSCVLQIDADDRLVLHAPFEPKPLIRQLRGMGLQAHSARVDVDHWTLAVSRD
ncbi:MAG: DUF2249 domain-containing protein [Candidatus Lambdaproteobacteria bacterium]|nr:DUF2249 domain-containing protein [Candidatus Lambdaproteobacteria bacterium]